MSTPRAPSVLPFQPRGKRAQGDRPLTPAQAFVAAVGSLFAGVELAPPAPSLLVLWAKTCFGGDFEQTLAAIEGLVAAGHAEKPDSYFWAALRDIASRADPLRRLSEAARRMWALFLTERRALMNELQGDAGVDPALDHRRAERLEEVIRLLGEERVERALHNLAISDWLCGRGEDRTVKLRPETCFSIAQLEAIAEEAQGLSRGRGARGKRSRIVPTSSPEHLARLAALSVKGDE